MSHRHDHPFQANRSRNVLLIVAAAGARLAASPPLSSPRPGRLLPRAGDDHPLPPPLPARDRVRLAPTLQRPSSLWRPRSRQNAHRPPPLPLLSRSTPPSPSVSHISTSSSKPSPPPPFPPPTAPKPAPSRVLSAFISPLDLFSRAAAVVAADPAALAVLLLEDIDRLCVRRSHASQTNVQVVAQLLTAIDGLLATPRVLVLATTTRPFDLDPALRRAGRFDREITLLPPSAEQRLAILKVLFPRVGLETAEWLPELALRTRGFTGADLELFATRAAASGAMSQLAQERVLSGVTPSAMKGEERVSGIPWESIGGMESVKELFRKVRILACFLSDNRMAHRARGGDASVPAACSAGNSAVRTPGVCEDNVGACIGIPSTCIILDIVDGPGGIAVCGSVGGEDDRG